MTYEEYIKERIKDQYKGDPRLTLGKCVEEVHAMHQEFPELEVVKGHVYVEWFAGHQRERKRGHWWLVTSDGDIVDPTAGQFPVIERYEAYVEGAHVRVGTCMNCGEPLWGAPGAAPTFCGRACELSYARYVCGMEDL